MPPQHGGHTHIGTDLVCIGGIELNIGRNERRVGRNEPKVGRSWPAADRADGQLVVDTDPNLAEPSPESVHSPPGRRSTQGSPGSVRGSTRGRSCVELCASMMGRSGNESGPIRGWIRGSPLGCIRSACCPDRTVAGRSAKLAEMTFSSTPPMLGRSRGGSGGRDGVDPGGIRGRVCFRVGSMLARSGAHPGVDPEPSTWRGAAWDTSGGRRIGGA